MTDPTTAALQLWLDTHPAPPMPRDVSDLDEETLLRSRLSAAGRKRQRGPRVIRPTEPWIDELAACEIGGAR